MYAEISRFFNPLTAFWPLRLVVGCERVLRLGPNVRTGVSPVSGASGGEMKSWVRQVRALTASMVELRKDRTRWERHRCELRAGMPEGGATLLQASGFSRDEVLGLSMPEAGAEDTPELRRVMAELARIDETLAVLERKVRTIVETAGDEGRPRRGARPGKVPPAAANVLPFRRPAQPQAAHLDLVEVA